MVDSINVLTQTVDNLKMHMDDAMYATSSSNRGNYQPRFQGRNFQPRFQSNNYQNRPQGRDFQPRFQNGNPRGRGGFQGNFQRSFQGRGRGNYNSQYQQNSGTPRGGARGGQGPGQSGPRTPMNCDFCGIPGHILFQCRSLGRLLENRGLKVGRKPNYDQNNPQRNNDRFQYINEAELHEFVNSNIDVSTNNTHEQSK